MANQIITAVGLTREALRILSNNLKFTQHCYKGYSKNNYGKADPKEGSILNVRIPNKYKSHVGRDLVLEEVIEKTVPIELTTQRHIGFTASRKDYTLDIDNFSRMYLEPTMDQIANDIDFDGTALYKKVWNQIGTPGVTPASSAIYTNSGAILDDNCVARDDKRIVLLTPTTQAAVVESLKGLFQSSSEIAAQYRKGVMGIFTGYMFEMDQNLRLHTTGNFGTGADLGADMVEGSNVFELTDFTGVTGTPTLNEGDIFTVAGVYSVNPKNKQTTGRLQQFVTVSTVWSSPTLSVTVQPVPIASQTNPLQNVTALGLDQAAVVFAGDQNSTYPINLAFHEDAFVFVSANLESTNDVDFETTQVYEGISLKTVRAYDIYTDKRPCRTDVLYGFACPRPEMACRIIG